VFNILDGQTALVVAFRGGQVIDRQAKFFYGCCGDLLMCEAKARRRTLCPCEALFRIHARLYTLINVSGLKVQGGEAG
jgi:hypothetical protein